MSWSDRGWGRGESSAVFGGQRPQATLWIVGVTVGVSILVWGLGGGVGGVGANRVVDSLALDLSAVTGLQLWRFLTYALLHGSVGHLFWNMLLIFVIGNILERHFGPRRFTTYYCAFALVGALGYVVELALFRGPNFPPCIGASGAALGLVTLLGSRFPRLELMFWGIIPIRCWALAALLVGLDLLAIIAYQGADGTAHSVHLAGALGGFVAGFVLPRTSAWREAWVEERERQRRDRERRRDEDDRLELDRVLEKIKTEGMDRLSERERRFLLSQSEKLKDRR